MPIPDFQSIMLPLLKILADGKVYKYREILEVLVREFQVTEAERKEMLPSGQQEIFSNRVGWAKTYLKKAGLIESPQRATFVTHIPHPQLSQIKKAIKVVHTN